jgi:Arc/MetJ-type ribon-helix-helix transcriptional regulator
MWDDVGGIALPKDKKPYENVGIQRRLYEEVRDFVDKSGRYRSVSEFVHEAVRIRLELLLRELKERKET